MIGAILGTVATTALGSVLGNKSKDKRKVKVKKDPVKKLADLLQMREAIMGAAGKESWSDILENQRRRSEFYTGLGHQTKDIQNTYGRLGVEGPGKMDLLNKIKETGMQSLIKARTETKLAKKAQGMKMLGNVARRNPDRLESKIKKGPMWAKIASGAMQGLGGALGGMKPQAATPTTGIIPSTPTGGGVTTVGGTGRVNIPQTGGGNYGGGYSLGGKGTTGLPGATGNFNLTGNKLKLMSMFGGM